MPAEPRSAPPPNQGSRAAPTAAKTLVALWGLAPVLGNLTPFLYLILMPLRRDTGLPLRRDLLALAGLAGIYVGYIIGRSALAAPDPGGPGFGDVIEDTVPLLITTALAAWTIRARVALDMARIFKGLVLLQLGVLSLMLAEQVWLGTARPSLLLKNPLNLAPLLIVPALLVSDGRLAPSQIWRAAGLLAFAASVIAIGAVAQARGMYLVLGLLVMLRIASELCQPGRAVQRLARAGVILGVFTLSSAAITADSAIGARFIPWMAAAQTPDLPSPTAKTIVTPWISPDQDLSLYYRSAMLQAGLAAGQDAPWFGYGAQHRVGAAEAYLPADVPRNFSHLHNDFVTHLVAGGLPAVILLGLLVLFPTLCAWRYPTQRRLRREIGLTVTLAFAGTAFVNNILFVPIWTFLLPLSLLGAVMLLDGLDTGTDTPT